MPWLILILRWLAWTVLVVFESVVGWPWLSFYLAGEWLLKGDESNVLISLFLMTLVLAAVYQLPLVVAALLLTAVWQLKLRVAKQSWQQWLIYGLGALITGIFSGVNWNFLSGFFTVISWLVFIKISGGFFRRKVWQAPNLNT